MKKALIKFLNKLPYIKGLKRDLISYERWGLPGHFYNPIPSLEEIEMYSGYLFTVPRDEKVISGIDFNVQKQLELLKSFIVYYAEIPFSEIKNDATSYYFENPNYSYTDAIILYSMIRHFKPSNIIEIGSGYSSCATLDTNEKFFDNQINCSFIEPYPELLKSLIKKKGKKGCTIISSKIQDIDLDYFSILEENDILFIDSSHVMKAASDLQYILFNIIPSLKKGVIIHFHDIFYPFEYPKKWFTENFYAWNEIYVIKSFLMYNHSFEMLFFNHFLTTMHHEWFDANMPLCLKNPGGGLWIRKMI